jgi:hypothetical protein
VTGFKFRHVPPAGRALAAVDPAPVWYITGGGQVTCPNWLTTPCTNDWAEVLRGQPRPPRPPKRKPLKRGKRRR